MSRLPPRPLGSNSALGRIQRTARLLERYEAGLRRTARRFALSPEDAEDAFQRAAEILVQRAPEIDDERLLAWAQVVTRREGLAIIRERRRHLARIAEDRAELDRLAAPGRDPADQLAARERIAQAARRLDSLKPQERRALALQAAGCSYAEIQAITGWTYTKVNRCLAEGRATLRRSAESAAAGQLG